MPPPEPPTPGSGVRPPGAEGEGRERCRTPRGGRGGAAEERARGPRGRRGGGGSPEGERAVGGLTDLPRFTAGSRRATAAPDAPRHPPASQWASAPGGADGGRNRALARPRGAWPSGAPPPRGAWPSAAPPPQHIEINYNK